jgi:crossover junction endodeoxyribonuclease RuvC
MILGLDPGTSGAIAALDGHEVALLADLPVHMLAAKGRGDRAELDVHTLHTLIAGLGPIEHVFVERVAARPGNGSVSMFRFGQACGAIYATLVVLGISITLVQPKAWQRHHGIGPTPDAARQRAVQLYPAIAPRLARKADGNRADALLIADYGRRRLLEDPATPHAQREQRPLTRENVGNITGRSGLRIAAGRTDG